MNICPQWLQDEVVRRNISLPAEIPEGMVFKIAETEEELEASFRLVYDAYVKLGYCDENPYKLRATIYHALSTTTTLLAMDHGKVIGTLTIVRDNFFKLPSEKIFDMKSLRGKAQRLAEITSLVIDPNYRREKGGCVLFTLLRFMHEYSTNYFGVDNLVVSVHPKDAFFYRSLLLFKDIPGTKVEDYMGAPAVALNLDLNTAFNDFKKVYSKRKKTEDLFSFFILRKIPNLKFPKKVYNKINFPVVSIEYFEELFMRKLGLGDIYYEEKILAFASQPKAMQREFMRIEVELPGKLTNETGEFAITGKMKDVSRNGFKFFSEKTLPVGMEFTCEVHLTESLTSRIHAKAMWSHVESGVGFKILKGDDKWNDFIDYLYQDQYGKVA